LETAALKDPARVVPLAKTALLNRAVLAECDSLDGVKDGFLSDPQKCRFNPSTLLCRGADADDCLTAPQLDSIKQAYAPANKRTGERIYPGLVPGSEAGWALLAAIRPEPNGIDLGMFRYVAHEDAAWDWRSFDLDRDMALADKKAGSMTAVDPDLSAFKARGGKLLIYHGWNDGGSGGAISPLNTIEYFSTVLATMGTNQENWLRLFMVPGNGALRWWSGTLSIQCACGAGTVAGVGHRSRTNHGLSRRKQPCNHDTSAVPLSEGSDL